MFSGNTGGLRYGKLAKTVINHQYGAQAHLTHHHPCFGGNICVRKSCLYSGGQQAIIEEVA